MLPSVLSAPFACASGSAGSPAAKAPSERLPRIMATAKRNEIMRVLQDMFFLLFNYLFELIISLFQVFVN
jgi:hypothetical protein